LRYDEENEETFCRNIIYVVMLHGHVFCVMQQGA